MTSAEVALWLLNERIDYSADSEGNVEEVSRMIRAIADERDALRRERDEQKRVIDDAYAALGGDAWWMDPPDGGSPTLAEMIAKANEDGRALYDVKRERDAALALLRECREFIESAPMARDATRRKFPLCDRIDALLGEDLPAGQDRPGGVWADDETECVMEQRDDGAHNRGERDTPPAAATGVTDAMVEAACKALQGRVAYGWVKHALIAALAQDGRLRDELARHQRPAKNA